MTRWLAYPLLSLFVLIIWLLLNQSISPGHLLLGAVLAAAASWGMSALQQPGLRLGRPAAALRFAFHVIADIVRSNFAVASVILRRASRRHVSGFMVVQLELRDPYALAVLACIVTATPGTLWVNYNSANGMLLLHILDLVDEEDWRRVIKQRYERPLLEIFE